MTAIRKEKTPTSWSVSDAKSKLSEVLRFARQEGPQYIGRREDQCVVVSREEWEKLSGGKTSLTSWLLEHSPKVNMDLPKRGQSRTRPVPFIG